MHKVTRHVLSQIQVFIRRRLLHLKHGLMPFRNGTGQGLHKFAVADRYRLAPVRLPREVLVRVLCLHCREAYVTTDQELAEIGVRPPGRSVKLYRSVGCDKCSHTGYYGRKGIFEMMLVDDKIRSMISRNVDSKAIKKAATDEGMGTLRADGARKVLSGVTSVRSV